MKLGLSKLRIEDKPLDLGFGMTAIVVRDEDLTVLGLYWHHPGCPAGHDVHNWIPVKAKEGHYGWNLASIKPLTVYPAIRCSLCDVNGFIQEGNWVPG